LIVVAGAIRNWLSCDAIHRVVARWFRPVLNSVLVISAAAGSVVSLTAETVSAAPSAGSVGFGVNAVPASEVVCDSREMSTWM
jgi:hypothetical protein